MFARNRPNKFCHFIYRYVCNSVRSDLIRLQFIKLKTCSSLLKGNIQCQANIGPPDKRLHGRANGGPLLDVYWANTGVALSITLSKKMRSLFDCCRLDWYKRTRRPQIGLLSYILEDP